MNLQFEVISEESSSYTSKGKVTLFLQLTLLDRATESTCKSTFDFRVLEEKQRAEWAGKLVGKTVTVGFTNWKVFNGRMEIIGPLVSVGVSPRNQVVPGKV